MPPDRGSATAGLTLARELARSLGDDARIHETHVSVVVVAGEQAVKLKKPIRFAFVDQSTPERRRALCEEEVRVNQALAADIVRGVAALVRGPGGVELAPPDAPAALDHAVVMRRFDEADTLGERLRSRRLTEDELAAVGGVLARFHAGAEPALDVEGPARRWRRNLAELAEAAHGTDRDVLVMLYAFGAAFGRRWAAELERRAGRGLVRDGHGDLRAEHVLIEDGRVLVVDRLEFDARLREVDVCEDIAFLTMDLERLEARPAAESIVHAYSQAGGDPGPAPLLAFFAAYRALVRAKIAALAGKSDKAAGLIELAQRLAWRARQPLRLLVTGPPASGKSTLARAIAGAAEVPLLSSDAVRPRDDEGHGRYDPAARADVYAALATAAKGADSFVIDATFGERRLQEAFFGALGDPGRLAVIECVAPPDVLARRARDRSRGGPGDSEAGPEVAADLLERFVGLARAGVPRLRVDTTVPAATALVEVAAWIDGL